MSPATWVCALMLSAAPTPAAPAVASAQAQAPSFLDEPSQVHPDKPRSVAQAVGMALVVGMMAVGGCVAYGLLQARRGPKVSGDKINLLAYKALGGRQRLALVEVCGERLLLSANEREVTLLSHLPGAPEAAEAEDAPEGRALSEAQTVSPAASSPAAHVPEVSSASRPEPQTVAALEQALAQQDRAAPGEVALSASAYSADLAGLHRWQTQPRAERRA